MTFEELEDSLAVEGFEESPAQLHGLFSGRIAGGERLAPQELKPVLIDCLESEEELVENAFACLEMLYREILNAFQQPDFGFKLLLPPDEAPVRDRVIALSEWCQCFISGLGDSGLGGRKKFSEDFISAMSDLAAIARVGFDGEPGGDDEADLTELEEYVRVAAMLIYSELNDAGPEMPAERTLH